MRLRWMNQPTAMAMTSAETSTAPKMPRALRTRPSSGQVVAEDVAERAVEGGPDDAAEGVPEEEGAPLHFVDAGEEGGPAAQDGEEAPDEDGFAAV